MKGDPTPSELVRGYQTSGTENWYHHPLGIVYTDGIKFLADTCEAWWLVDLVASHQPAIRKKMRSDGLRAFQVWRLRWLPDVEECTWVADAWTDTPESPGGEDGPASVLLASQEIGYSSFPMALSPFEFWVEQDVMLLKAEH